MAASQSAVRAELNKALIKHNLSWDLLFGDADMCECGECNSVYSAAAYFVELLNYLRNNNLDPNAPGTMAIRKNDRFDISNTPLEKLFNRRPDLGCLELTCQNTNTLIPYVDLVNEVMENYVAFQHLKPFNVDDETSGELLAEPQHTEYQAYCILKKEVYPFTLPYHQPIDAARIYLKFLDTSRYELIDTFRKNNAGDDAELTRLKDEVLDRAADAEFLEMTKEEYVILTKECFESIALIRIQKNDPSLSKTDYESLIGVKSVHKYYGYDDDATMRGDNGLTLIKKEFLRRTGIDYYNLVDLLLTETINPCMPKGRAKTIMESLRFSYRFLQNILKAFGNDIDKMAKFLVGLEKSTDAWIIYLAALKEQINLLLNRKNLICDSTQRMEHTEKDIICWVKCYFEKIGQMIVIESGTGCVNGGVYKFIDARIVKAEGVITRKEFTVKDCKIYSEPLRSSPVEIGSIDKKTGEVKFNSAQQEFNASYAFTGDRGEKGIFLDINHVLYLVIVEQKDSCDLDNALLQHLDGSPLTVEEYDRIHRFLRLWRKLGWTIDEIDKAIIGLSVQQTQPIPGTNTTNETICDDSAEDCTDTKSDCEDCAEDISKVNFDINPHLIHQLVAVKKLLDLTGLEVIKLLSFWKEISTSGTKSLYQRIFLTHNLLGIDKVFKADEKGNYLTGDVKLRDHLPVVMAAFNLSADDIETIMIESGMEDKLNLENLSVFYRYRLLAKILSIRIPAFVSVYHLFDDIFLDAHLTLAFIERWAKMEEAGFTYQQMNYIIKDKDDEKKPFAPTQRDVLQLSKTLFDGLNAIDEAHKDLTADPTIAEEKLKIINIQEQANTAVVRAKASLLFETDIVEKIVGFLEGTNVFITTVPQNLVLTMLSDTSKLKAKLKHDMTLGSVQVTGILTASEIDEYQALSNDSQWKKSVKFIQKQQDKLFKELLLGIFENEKTKTADQIKHLKEIIKAGDITVPLNKIPDGQSDPNTAPPKRVAFLEIFLPYLRQQLTHRFVIDTLANFAAIEPNVTDLLVSDILKLETSSDPIYSIFENIKDSKIPSENNWKGYLIPSADAIFTFVIKNSIEQPTISLDGIDLNPKSQGDQNDKDDPDNLEWWSDAKPLQAGKLYKLATTGVELKNIFWKTPASAITAIPSSALIPDFASTQCKPALIALKKAAMFVSGFNLSADEIKFLNDNNINFDKLDFNALTLPHWLRLEAYTRLRNSLPQTQFNILDFWGWTFKKESDVTQLSNKIYDLTTWKQERIEKLMAADHFNIGTLADYRNEINLLKLQEALKVADKIGMDIGLLFNWAIPTSQFNKSRKIADSIKHAIRAKYNQTDWEQVVKPLHDQLRNHQRDALTAYLLQQKKLIEWNVTDADGLFEYFLIDVQMDACMETSRIKQALSSVQLYVQRCFLGLESKIDDKGKELGVANNILDRNRWDWMQRYRVWEANRKVFLYPENWIESSLRDDKSPFFKELESELLQKDINKQNVTDALKSYLYKVDEVANMEVVGLYIEGTIKSKVGGKIQWDKKNPKLHVFSRTRNAPYFFYYRYLALDEMNWYPWEKMQIDIPSYDVVNQTTQEVSDNGCYLTPVVWNERLLIFFPQIIKKTKPAEVKKILNDPNDPSKGTHDATIREMADQPPESNQPINYYEIKMAWSEYRNGKWTQKQLSNNVLIFGLTPKRRIDQLIFIPEISDKSITIHIEDQDDSDLHTFLGFTFSGSFFNDDNQTASTYDLPTSVSSEFGTGATVFQKFSTKSKIQSLQLTNSGWGNDDAVFTVESNKVSINYSNANINSLNFYHPYTHDLLGIVNLTGDLKEFFGFNLNSTKIPDGAMTGDAFGLFDPDNNSLTINSIYHELKRPYSLYNWELFFHTPILLADSLSKAQQYEEAMKWFHYVFNPIADGKDLTKEKIDKRFWQFKPFRETNSQRILDSIFNNLTPNASDDAINEWRNKPFMPHVVARSRPAAYMKWVVMKYIDNLLAWGDYLFRQDTIETLNQATQLYVLAGHILGPKPMMIPKRGKIKPQTYFGLLDKWDAFGNAMVELELVAPFSNQTPLPVGVVNSEIAHANIFGIASSLYFCIPNNPKLMGYWDTLADRLYKIRHCLNIEGIFRKLPLFEPPIDPALLVKAAAQGLSIASLLNDLNTPMPNYRFYYLLQKALELCNELKSLGGAMLSAIEKKDNESIALIRAKHEGVMQNLMMEIKTKQLEEAQKNIESLLQNRKTPEARMKYYLKLSGLDDSLVPVDTTEFNGIPNDIVTVDGDSGLKLISFEKEDLEKASEAQEWQRGIGIIETLASILHIIPVASADVKPIGIGAGVAIHGQMFGNAAQAVARGLQVHASDLSFASTSAGKKGGFTRALQERIFQANAAGYELKQIDKQITAQEIRINIANKEISNQQKAIDNANDVEEFLKDKFSNEELYSWMRGYLKTLYHQVYSVAYELAKKAERTYCFERGLTSAAFIQSGYFDAGREGLLAGEQLYVGLKQLEAAYQNERGYDYEITKHLSLSQINPLAVIQLKQTGKCEFVLPEVLFDMDYPGHYKRRIKSLSVSIPCIVGPYTSINATLTLLENKFRNTAIGGNAYVEKTEESDERFSTYIIPIDAIAASTAQNDSGMFELNFKDERYLPFEGAGVISKWRLELPPKYRQFDYQSISDVIFHLKYTSSEGGERLKSAATSSLSKLFDNIEQELNETGLHVALSLKHDLPNEWNLLTRKDGDGSVKLTIGKSRLPYLAQFLPTTKIEDVMFFTQVKDNPPSYSINIDDNATPLTKIDEEWKLLRSEKNEDITLDSEFKLSVNPPDLKSLEELVLLVKYSF
ncbi:hypothetical protein MGMO_93c00040 [Methyloglobulus morosus KoM1]|uniref:Virulence plasmid A protein n=1 Tax=Methyloglobulus morosus KoM1 TaxID=1116472 RepID=V5DWD2_9GAMM|nr:neuraminidase-like domain-containing protein [Methyloglobulus morosus]ESS71646.1 hypothetical protein MGMO_93c00040 [Methyloglobulus morosus KoM1]